MERHYKRFRPNSPWYSGLPTLDIVGCQCSCRMCWTNTANQHPEKYPALSPEEVAQILSPYPKARISSGEPTLHPEHLLQVAHLLEHSGHTELLVETNGLALSESTVEAFSQLENVYFRLSLKGVDSLSSWLTSGRLIYHKQIEVAHLMKKYGCRFHCAIIEVFSPEWLEKVCLDIPPGDFSFVKDSSTVKSSLEVEELKYYPFNRTRIRQWLVELKEHGYT